MTTTENFATLFAEQDLERNQWRSGSLLTGTVIKMTPTHVLINVGLKSEGLIPLTQFRDENGQIHLKLGDQCKVLVETPEDGCGETRLSREKAKRAEVWSDMAQAYEDGKEIVGIVDGRVKGGFSVDVFGVRAFLPGSLIDLSLETETLLEEKKPLEFKIIKFDKKRNNVVLSRRAVVDAANSGERAAFLESLQEGQVLSGVVKSVKEYGAFVRLEIPGRGFAGVDGLLHKTDMSWTRVKHASELITVGERIEVKVLKVDRVSGRISLGSKHLTEDPWVEITQAFPVGMRLKGEVTNLVDYGAFVKITSAQGHTVEGLVHQSEMDWTNKNIHPAKLLVVGQELEVMILDIDQQQRRISLGMKQCQMNPWQAFARDHVRGERVSGRIKSVTTFGIFVGLEGGIDGLVHYSDISWDEPTEESLKEFKKLQDLDVIILGIDVDRERISLGLKQLDDAALVELIQQHAEGSILKMRVVEADQRGAILEWSNGLRGLVRLTEVSSEKIEDARQILSIGENVEAVYLGVERKARLLTLSIKAVAHSRVAE